MTIAVLIMKIAQGKDCSGSGSRLCVSIGGICDVAPRGPRAEFQQMAIEVAEEDRAPAAQAADLHILWSPRLAPVNQACLLDASEDGVELLLADMKRVVIHLEAVAAVIKIKGEGVVHLHRRERSHRAVIGKAEQVGEELCRRNLVTRRYDRVIERDSHGAPPS